MKYSPLHNFISGELIPDTVSLMDVISPSDGTVLSTVPLSNYEAVNKAVIAAEKAFPLWSSTPVKDRAQVFYKYKTLLEKHIDELSLLVQEENGKIFSEARAEIEKSIEQHEIKYNGQPIPRPAFWGGYIVIPETIEFWQGRASRLHDRIRYSLQPGETWIRERLSP